MSLSYNELLARLIQCEAGGEGETGMKAVASVLMNRLNAMEGEYGRINDLRSIIYQPYQFQCAVYNGGQNIDAVRPEQVHFDIADWALAGNRLPGLGDALWFFNPYADSCPYHFPNLSGVFVMRIGKHCFYEPTEEYYKT